MIIAIDGPAGAGKSTVAKILAKKLGFLYIDTGAMYRALTLKVMSKGINANSVQEVIDIAKTSKIDLEVSSDGPTKIFLDGKDVSLEIREPKVTKFVSDIAKIGPVREIMVQLQRKLGMQKDCVLDGRDIGTIVFPNADRKFFIDANFEERVSRRYKDLINLNINGVSKEQVAGDLNNRDTIDSTRPVAPLKKADDAIYLDTSSLSIEQVVETMLTYIKK